MPGIWRVEKSEATGTWDVYCGVEHLGTEFASPEEAEDFMREHLPEGWDAEWPTVPGWYWFWDPSFPDLVEPGQMRLAGKGSFLMYTRSSEMIYEKDYPGCRWHVMEKPPIAPRGSA